MLLNGMELVTGPKESLIMIYQDLYTDIGGNRMSILQLHQHRDEPCAIKPEYWEYVHSLRQKVDAKDNDYVRSRSRNTVHY